jgi:very-short-patch-repair endonuclease
MTLLYNKIETNGRRKELRNRMTPSEKKLWGYLRGSQFKGLKFRRQHSIGDYIVDFYCPELRLVIEIDGDSHFVAGARKYDERRENFIKSFKISCLRFTNQDVTKNIEGVLLKLEKFIGDHPQPLLIKEGRE